MVIRCLGADEGRKFKKCTTNCVYIDVRSDIQNGADLPASCRFTAYVTSALD